MFPATGVSGGPTAMGAINFFCRIRVLFFLDVALKGGQRFGGAGGNPDQGRWGPGPQGHSPHRDETTGTDPGAWDRKKG